MSKLKKDRIRMLNNLLNDMKNITQIYNPGTPAFTLILAAFGHINSLHHLEAETMFDEETLGVKFKDEKEK